MFVRLSVLLMIMALFVYPTKAEAVSYTVSNLAVDVEGETAIDAREKALAQARVNAFNVLKKRLEQAGGGSSLPTPGDSDIASMVNSFEINREKLSKNRYLASVNVAFNQRAVEGYIRRNSPRQTPDYTAGNYAGGGMQNNAQNPSQYGSQTGSDFENRVLERQQQRAMVMENQYGRAQASARANYGASLNQYRVRVDISDIRQWINVKKMLESTNSIENIEIDQISSRRAVINLSHRGSVSDLQNALIGRGMRLYENTEASQSRIPYILITRG